MSDPILILGMHRSGTSCLAGCLQAAGLTLGDVNTSAPHNAKGNREHERLRDIHDGLMAYHGYTWDHPPNRQLDWRPIDLKRMQRETAQFSEVLSWGFKDPRLIFCIKGWKNKFKPRFVATFRHPDSVANSLIRRAEKWGTPLARTDAHNLWIAYNRELLNITKSQDTPFIRFDVEPDDYQKRVRQVADNLGLEGSLASTFFSESLQHERPSEHDIPDACKPVWTQLSQKV